MSTGARGSVEGLTPSAPAHPSRAYILARLEAERRQALGCFEYERASEIGAQIAELSIGSPASPTKETTGRAAAGKQRTR